MKLCMLLQILLFSFVMQPAISWAADGDTLVANVELVKQAAPMLSALPSGAPQPVLYFLPHATSPSCGLVASTHAPTIMPILETIEDLSFPYCEGITDVSSFSFHGAKSLVYQYKQRDTREDTSTKYFFIRRSDAGAQPIEDLNMATAPKKESVRLIAAWGKWKLIGDEIGRSSFTTSVRDSIINEQAILHLSRKTSTKTCRTEMNLVSSESDLPPTTVSCNAILASASLVAGKATYFIVLLKDRAGKPLAQIFKAESSAVTRAAEVEQHLAPQIASGQVMKVKEALRKYLKPQ